MALDTEILTNLLRAPKDSDIATDILADAPIFNIKPSTQQSALYIPQISSEYVLKALINSPTVLSQEQLGKYWLSNDQLTQVTWQYLQENHSEDIVRWYSYLENLHENRLKNPKNLESFLKTAKSRTVSLFELQQNDAYFDNQSLRRQIAYTKTKAVRELVNAGKVIIESYPGEELKKIVRLHPKYSA